MASFEVQRVRVQAHNFPTAHDHITHVMLANRAVEPYDLVAANIAQGKRYEVIAGRRHVALTVGRCAQCFAALTLLAGPPQRANPLLRLERF